MHLAPWLFFTILALVCFGVVGLLQKLATDLMSAESALLWLIVGFLFLEPFIYPGGALLHYSSRSLFFRTAGWGAERFGQLGDPDCDEMRRQGFRCCTLNGRLSNRCLSCRTVDSARTHHPDSGPGNSLWGGSHFSVGQLSDLYRQ